MCKIDKNNQEIKPYHANLCIIGLSVIMVVVFFAFMFAFPLLLKWVYGIFANGKIWNMIPPVVEAGREDNTLSVLPDFLGGLCGIIIGFLFDIWFIEKIRKISRYKFLSSSVNREFNQVLNSINNACNGKLQHLIASSEKAAKENESLPKGISIVENKIHYDENLSGDIRIIKDFCKKQEINRWDLDDIVTNVENDAIFYRLPFMIGLKGKMTECLHVINGCILRFNDSDDENEMVNELLSILINIHKFFIYTGYKKVDTSNAI